MYELMFMCAGSAMTIIAAYIGTIGKDKPETIGKDKPEMIIVRDGSIVYECIEQTGEVLNIYYLREVNESGELYERRSTK